MYLTHYTLSFALSQVNLWLPGDYLPVIMWLCVFMPHHHKHSIITDASQMYLSPLSRPFLWLCCGYAIYTVIMLWLRRASIWDYAVFMRFPQWLCCDYAGDPSEIMLCLGDFHSDYAVIMQKGPSFNKMQCLFVQISFI